MDCSIVVVGLFHDAPLAIHLNVPLNVLLGPIGLLPHGVGSNTCILLLCLSYWALAHEFVVYPQLRARA